MVSDQEGAGRGCLSALRAKAWRHLGPEPGCAVRARRAPARACNRGARPQPGGAWGSSCRVSRATRWWSCGRMTEWLMESLRKDATGRGARGRQGPPWETGAAKPRGTPNCSF
ncbi:hypothetical protein PAHAL_2G344000 [Panicum hallii]|uniref:Uncharacterized protein n=1 Tax=Panicum hallii TaxID=206008 RepID=A0A2S3H1L8_9POAL|nr:hypothetical protein PAHAL_2G344000 [Panicum hallii]